MTSHAYYSKILAQSNCNVEQRGALGDQHQKPALSAQGNSHSSKAISAPCDNLIDFGDDLISLALQPPCTASTTAATTSQQKASGVGFASIPGTTSTNDADPFAELPNHDPWDSLTAAGTSDNPPPGSTYGSGRGAAPNSGAEDPWGGFNNLSASQTATTQLPNASQPATSQQPNSHASAPPNISAPNGDAWASFDPFCELATIRDAPTGGATAKGGASSITPTRVPIGRAPPTGNQHRSHGEGIANLLGDGDLFVLPEISMDRRADSCTGAVPRSQDDQLPPTCTSSPDNTSTPHGLEPCDQHDDLALETYRSSFVGETAWEQRELRIYALPLCNDRLVFLPVTTWREEEPGSQPSGPVGMMSSAVKNFAFSVSSYWNGMKEKDPDSFQNKVYRTGTNIMENMSAEERLMNSIPKAATKVVIYFPSKVDAAETRETLSKLAASYAVKSAGKATMAGLALPVAVGAEMLMVPGVGWFAAYQLYKNSVSAAGGQRLNQYLNKGGTRVCYAPEPKLDAYVARAEASVDSMLSEEDIEDLCNDLGEDSLRHALLELRARYLKRMNGNKEDGYGVLAQDERGGDADGDDNASGLWGPVNSGSYPASGFLVATMPLDSW
eukprot:gene26445-17544_t